MSEENLAGERTRRNMPPRVLLLGCRADRAASVSAGALVRVVPRPTWGREGAKGLFEARVDAGLRVPVEGASGQGGVYAASELLARLGRSVLRWKVFGGNLE